MWDSVEDTWKDKHNGATKNKNEAHAWTDCQKKNGLLRVHLWVLGQAIIYNLMTYYEYFKK